MVRALGIDFERRRLCGLSLLVSLVNFNIYVNGYSGSYPPANDLHRLQILHNGENHSLTVAFGFNQLPTKADGKKKPKPAVMVCDGLYNIRSQILM